MIRSTVLAIVVQLAMGSGSVFAALLVHEDFNYKPGAVASCATSATGLAGPSATFDDYRLGTQITDVVNVAAAPAK